MRTGPLLLAVVLAVAACDGSGPGPAATPTPPAPGASAEPSVSAGPPTVGPVADPILEQVAGPWRRFGIVAAPEVSAAVAAACALDAPADADPAARAVAVDLRGLDRATALFASTTSWWVCLATLDAGGVATTRLGARGTFTVAGPAPDAIEILDLSTVVDEDGTIRSVAVGRVGDLAAKVRAGFDDETYVTATMVGGWWAMWWPGIARPPLISALDSHDVSIGSDKT
jgi:hypothetical protein